MLLAFRRVSLLLRIGVVNAMNPVAPASASGKTWVVLGTGMAKAGIAFFPEKESLVLSNSSNAKLRINFPNGLLGRGALGASRNIRGIIMQVLLLVGVRGTVREGGDRGSWWSTNERRFRGGGEAIIVVMEVLVMVLILW